MTQSPQFPHRQTFRLTPLLVAVIVQANKRLRFDIASPAVREMLARQDKGEPEADSSEESLMISYAGLRVAFGVVALGAGIPSAELAKVIPVMREVPGPDRIVARSIELAARSLVGRGFYEKESDINEAVWQRPGLPRNGVFETLGDITRTCQVMAVLEKANATAEQFKEGEAEPRGYLYRVPQLEGDTFSVRLGSFHAAPDAALAQVRHFRGVHDEDLGSAVVAFQKLSDAISLLGPTDYTNLAKFVAQTYTSEPV